MTRLACTAAAKINLTLHVGPPRADGLHPLESLVAFADVGDLLMAEPADTLRLTLSGPFAAALEGEADNLVLRAARALAPAMRAVPHAHLHLVKALPIASGIGGGSADAAAALRLLARLWSHAGDAAPPPKTAAALTGLAAGLGADVPACLGGQPVFMRGAGEILTPVDIAPLDAVLVNAGEPAPTGAVYRAFDAMGGAGPAVESPTPGDLAERGRLLAYLEASRNDLEPAARRIAPSIGAASALLSGDPDIELVRMSGSGATVFGLAADRDAAQRAAARLAQARPDWWICVARLGAVDAAVRLA